MASFIILVRGELQNGACVDDFKKETLNLRKKYNGFSNKSLYSVVKSTSCLFGLQKENDIFKKAHRKNTREKQE